MKTINPITLSKIAILISIIGATLGAITAFRIGLSYGKAQIVKEAITIHTKGNCDALVDDMRHIYK